MVRYFKVWLFSMVLIHFYSLRANESVLIFPAFFEKGVAFSAFQNGGSAAKNNWSVFEKKKIKVSARTLAPFNPVPAIADNQRIGSSAEFYKHAFQDIQLLKELGCTSVRFSVEWADIEPEEGVFNYQIMSFWRAYCHELVKNGIKPMITLYHWVHPLWFEKKGAFAHATNIPYFVRYCQFVFNQLSDLVPLWCTINEPTVISGCGYILGIHAPGKFLALKEAGKVLQNLLYAHVTTYKALKAVAPAGVQIGFAHAMLLFEPYKTTINLPWLSFDYANPISKITARMMNFAFGHSIVKEFFIHGHFDYTVPGVCSFKSYCPEAPECLDFFGLNFYSQVVVGGSGPTCYPDQIMTEMDYPIWPEKMYEALHDVALIGKPIYITENGLSDAQDNNRPDFIRSYLESVYRATLEGCNVRGYYHWTLMDNFEWQEGYNKKFGLYQVDFDSPLKTRTPRASTEVYRDFFKIAAVAA